MKKQISILLGLGIIFTSLTASAKESILTNWTVSKSGAAYYDIVCDRNEVSDGGSNSLRMYVEKSSDSGYVEIRATGVLAEKNTDYVFEFDYKTDSEAETIDTTVYAGSASRNLLGTDERTLSGGTEWQKYSAEFATPSNQNVITVRVKLSEDKVNLWIDNISLIKKDTDANLLMNPDMNEDLDIAPGSVTDVTYSDIYADDITVSWVNPTDADVEGIIVKDVKTGEETTYGKDITSFVIEDAPRGTTYEFEISAVDIDGNVSPVSSVSFMADVIEYVIGEPVVSEADGMVNVSVSAMNNKVTEGKKITLVAFLYSGDVMIDAKAVINTVPVTSENVNTELMLALPEGKTLSDCEVKTYVIDSFESMQEV